MKTKSNNTTILLSEALSILIKDSESGKRVQRNGSKVKKGTIVIYKSVKSRYEQFEEYTGKTYELLIERKSSERIRIAQTKYWKRFYSSYRKYLFSNKVDGHDNYVTMHMKTLKLAIVILPDFQTRGLVKHKHTKFDYTNETKKTQILCGV